MQRSEEFSQRSWICRTWKHEWDRGKSFPGKLNGGNKDPTVKEELASDFGGGRAGGWEWKRRRGLAYQGLKHQKSVRFYPLGSALQTNVFEDHLGILLKGRFWISESGRDQEPTFLPSSPLILLLPVWGPHSGLWSSLPTAQDGSHQPHVVTEHLKCGYWVWGARVFI